MQLSGPPTFNGTQAPYPDRERPLEAAFQPDTDVETYVTTRSGRKQRTSERAYRARFRFVWEAITYDQAHDLLSAASQHPVTVVPRTKQPGDADRVQEYGYECRVVEDLSTATPLYRQGPQGKRLARVVLEFQSLETYERRPPARRVSVRSPALAFMAQSGVSVTTPISDIIITVSSSSTLLTTAVGVTTTPPPSRTVSVSNAGLQVNAASSLSVTIPPVPIAAGASQSFSATGVGVSRSTPGARTVSVANGQLQTTATGKVSITLPSVPISASASQALSVTGVGVTRSTPGARTVSVSNASLQTTASASVSATVPQVTVSASTSQGLTTTGVGVSRTPPPSRSVSVSNASLQTSAASSITADLPTVTVSASTSQGLSATGVGVTRDEPDARIVSVSNGQLQTSAASSVSVQENAPPNAALTASATFGTSASFDASGSTDPDGDTLEFRYDPGDGSGFTAWGQGVFYSHTYPSSGTYIATVEVREQNTADQLSDSASDSVTVQFGGLV